MTFAFVKWGVINSYALCYIEAYFSRTSILLRINLFKTLIFRLLFSLTLNLQVHTTNHVNLLRSRDLLGVAVGTVHRWSRSTDDTYMAISLLE
ncbi:MAG: hypothetical protein CLLPBCKN_000906 [Chroococcidiopsis cubana SAG 39.79]|nr:hypothetical protein [Chroococcidiopsis cubana SAG 39.79]